MTRRFSYPTQAAVSFLASLLAGYWLSKREDGPERLRMNVIVNVVGTLGMLVGYRLANR